MDIFICFLLGCSIAFMIKTTASLIHLCHTLDLHCKRMRKLVPSVRTYVRKCYDYKSIQDVVAEMARSNYSLRQILPMREHILASSDIWVLVFERKEYVTEM